MVSSSELDGVLPDLASASALRAPLCILAVGVGNNFTVASNPRFDVVPSEFFHLIDPLDVW